MSAVTENKNSSPDDGFFANHPRGKRAEILICLFLVFSCASSCGLATWINPLNSEAWPGGVLLGALVGFIWFLLRGM